MSDLRGRCFVLAMLAAGSAGAAAASPPTPPTPSAPPAPAQSIVVEAASSHVDYATDTARFEHIVISQGGTRVTAEQGQATGLGLNNSTWTFEGNVTLSLPPQIRLHSDRATVEVRDDRVTRAIAMGTPVSFEAQRSGSRPAVDGEANEVVYEAQSDTVRLSGEAWLSGGQKRISGPVLTYDIRAERLSGVSPAGTRRVHITVTPQPPHEPPPKRRP